MKITPASFDEFQAAIESDFQCKSSKEGLLIAVASEHLRAMVFLEAAEPSNIERYPVPTLRLTLSLTPRLAPFVAKDADNSLEYLSHLAALSDLIRCNGKWYAAPLRLLEIDDSKFLLVGGCPVHSLPARFRADIQTVGRARIMEVTDRNREFVSKLPKQRLDDWLGLPHKDMKMWAVEFKKQCTRAMVQPFEMADSTVWTGRHWVEIGKYNGFPTMVLYRRRVSQFGNTTFDYGMAKLHTARDTPAHVLGVCEITKNNARRIQGANDDCLNRERLEYTRRGALVLLRVPHPLPTPESAFLSLGWPAPSNHTSGIWPREYYFSNRLVPLIERALNCLGYELIEKSVRKNNEK